jgi:hypothetical protein
MSVATVPRPNAASLPGGAAPVPLFTRHTLGAIEAARDRRLKDRNHAVHRYTSPDTPRVSALSLVPRRIESAGHELDRWDDEAGASPRSRRRPSVSLSASRRRRERPRA